MIQAELDILNKPKEETFYRVVCGSYVNKEKAIEQQAKLKEKGFDSFIAIFKK